MLVLGVDPTGADNDADRLSCPIVDELRPIVQKHDIEGLVMGCASASAREVADER